MKQNQKSEKDVFSGALKSALLALFLRVRGGAVQRSDINERDTGRHAAYLTVM